ncbi:MAG: phosphate signaling complex protein PhoU [Candidatus Thermoplasmatota archaeon]|nr:phosphate signaling complex protein PhoU [Candidatus Thermoplasmatota archaeon]MBU4189980.1 phosphate signaling complex protein PhoU [Candidatus Thermoplasmatota archaeon]MBU4256292.1 phosphate signaling complex protein PhoU [Candidatus Thermoplasmatota archaeon]MCG2826350.1 phosphate signaling complex protein PhoU [Thermoplasmatales archaeon]
MLRKHFHDELETITHLTCELGELVKNAVEGAVKSVISLDVEKAKKVIDGDKGIGMLVSSIEKECYRLLSLQAPVAVDLRAIVSYLKVFMELERIGDEAKNISEAALELHSLPPETAEILDKMGVLGIDMIETSMKVLNTGDEKLAEELAEKDDMMDEMYKNFFQHLVKSAEPGRIHDYFKLLLVSRYLERIGDHACNIGEKGVYIFTSKRIKLT